MAIRRLSTASIKTGSKSNKLWDQDTQQGSMVLIGSNDMNGAVTAFGFSNIPQIYQDLMLVVSLRSTSSASPGWIINSNPSGAVYGVTMYRGDGAASLSSRGSSMSYGASQVGAIGQNSTSTNATMITHFFNYTNSTNKKTWAQKTANDLNGSGFVAIEAHLTSSTLPITAIACSTANASIYWNGTATLYGIKAGA